MAFLTITKIGKLLYIYGVISKIIEGNKFTTRISTCFFVKIAPKYTRNGC
jgi:hypothetical protein